ncbi:MAG: PHP domain-containing protein [Gammaproteobacteria bacterium]|nr:MAG: PHP domain-containing protein [Gammaproteobacteria bacterium]
MIADLHCHSTASDGELSPDALVRRAMECGVDTLAITDHDTVDACAELHAADFPAIRLIPGIEFSTRWHNMGVHVIGLDIDLESTTLAAAIRQQKVARRERAAEISARLAKRGIEDALDGALSFAGNAQIGRPHFARFLIARGYVRSPGEAFRKYLGAGKAGDVKQYWPEMRDVIGWIRSANGTAILAHPAKYKLTNVRLAALADAFQTEGGQAIEVISGQQPIDVTRRLGKLCTDRGLLASCGSDFHGPGQPWSELGRFGSLPDSCRPVWELWQDRDRG